MSNIRERLSGISVLVGDITETARGVNTESHERKNITVDGLKQIDDLLARNKKLLGNFEKIYNNLKKSEMGIENNAREFESNVEYFKKVINSIDDIKDILNTIGTQIEDLTVIVKEIRDDTDEIFTLALNASIVSSKYSHTSGVFDILANKLDEMSNYINQNLDNIVIVVKPITGGINQLMEENSVILGQIETSRADLMKFPETLGSQKESINELYEKGNQTNEMIKQQKKMLEEITEKFVLMDSDAEGSISGSASVIKTGESLGREVYDIISSYDEGINIGDKLDFVKEESVTIWNNARNVNEKSMSQLDFSLSSLEFCDSMVSESDQLRETAMTFNGLSVDNSKMAESLALNLEALISQIVVIENQVEKSNETIQKFNLDYNEIDSIIEFLKNILKSMKIIGMLSRIEASRDPEEFQGFMTISENISKLQDKIQNNIPLIEQNIIETHQKIDSVNTLFQDISSDFDIISGVSNTIIVNLRDISSTSSNSEKLSKTILEDSETLESALEKLRVNLNTLTEIVKKPIDGSAQNVERAKKIEVECNYIISEMMGTPIPAAESKETPQIPAVTEEEGEIIDENSSRQEEPVQPESGIVEEEEKASADLSGDEVLDNSFPEDQKITDPITEDEFQEAAEKISE